MPDMSDPNWMNPPDDGSLIEDILPEEDTTSDEMNAIASMLSRANKQGLLTEVIWSALQSSSKNIPAKCMYGLMEWDC
jgi:hypothetical protein